MQWSTDEQAIAYDRRSDGMYPLMTNDRKLSAAQVLQAHKGQPMIEKRFEQIKTVHQIAPVFLRTRVASRHCSPCTRSHCWCRPSSSASCARPWRTKPSRKLPIYPEQRQCAHPTTEQVLRLFSLAERHQLRQHGRTVQAFNLTLTDLQRKVLALLGVPASTF